MKKKVEKEIVAEIKNCLQIIKNIYDKTNPKNIGILNFSYKRGVIDGLCLILNNYYNWDHSKKRKEFGENYNLLLKLTR